MSRLPVRYPGRLVTPGLTVVDFTEVPDFDLALLTVHPIESPRRSVRIVCSDDGSYTLFRPRLLGQPVVITRHEAGRRLGVQIAAVDRLIAGLHATIRRRTFVADDADSRSAPPPSARVDHSGDDDADGDDEPEMLLELAPGRVAHVADSPTARRSKLDEPAREDVAAPPVPPPHQDAARQALAADSRPDRPSSRSQPEREPATPAAFDDSAAREAARVAAQAFPHHPREALRGAIDLPAVRPPNYLQDRARGTRETGHER